MLQLHGTKVQISREGVQTVWAQFYADSYEGIATVPGTFNGVSGGRVDLVEISAAQAEEGAQYVVTAKYEGIASESMVRPTYEWQSTESQEKIQTNPNWEELKKRYGGKLADDAQTVIWDKTIKATKSGKEQENPMLGVDSYLSLGGTWNETMVYEEIPDDIWEGMWSIVDSVPGNLPTPTKRLWLVMPPEIQQRGACYTVTRSWRLTGEMTDARLEATRLIYVPVK